MWRESKGLKLKVDINERIDAYVPDFNVKRDQTCAIQIKRKELKEKELVDHFEQKFLMIISLFYQLHNLCKT